jgi:hypothetical protein
MGEEEGRSTGLGEKMDKLLEKFGEEEEKKINKKDKKFKMKKLSKAKLKKNFVVVIYVNTNLEMDIKTVQIENNAIYIKETETFYPLTSEYIIRHKGMPVIILHGDALTPVHPKVLLGLMKPEDEPKLSMYQKVLFALLKKAQIQDTKKKFNIAAIVIIVIIIAAIIAAVLLLKKKTPA